MHLEICSFDLPHGGEFGAGIGEINNVADMPNLVAVQQSNSGAAPRTGQHHRIDAAPRAANDLKEDELSIIGSMLRRRRRVRSFRTIDGGHPAPYPDMTDEQLYNYEIAFKVARKTFERPPVAAASVTDTSETIREAPKETQKKPDGDDREPHASQPDARKVDAEPDTGPQAEPSVEIHVTPQPANRSVAPGPLDLSRPVRLVTTKQPVEIITTRARHPVYKVHGYIGDADIATVFTLDGRLSENGLCFLENVPEQHQLYLNIYLNEDPAAPDRYRITQHATIEQAEAAAAGRLAGVAVQFDL